MTRSDRARVVWARRIVRKSGDRFQRDRLDELQDFYAWDDLKNRLLDELGAVVEMSQQYQGYPCRYEISVEDEGGNCRRVVLISTKLDVERGGPVVGVASSGFAKVSRLLFEHKNDGSLIARLVLSAPIHPFMVEETEVFLLSEPRASQLLTSRGVRRVRSLVSYFLRIDECLYPCRKPRAFDSWKLRYAFYSHSQNFRVWQSFRERAVENHKFNFAVVVGVLAAVGGVFVSEAVRYVLNPESGKIALFFSFAALMTMIFLLSRVMNRH